VIDDLFEETYLQEFSKINSADLSKNDTAGLIQDVYTSLEPKITNYI